MRPIIFLALVAPVTAFGAEQCFFESGTYGALTVTASGPCGPQLNYGGIVGVWMGEGTTSSSCTFTFDHPVDARTMRIPMTAHSNDGAAYGERATFFFDGAQHLVAPSDLDNTWPTGGQPLTAVNGAVESEAGDGRGTVYFTSAPSSASSLEIVHDDFLGSPNGTIYLVCVDDAAVVVVDSDGDGTEDAADCAPSDATIHPGAAEVCDGVDQDCDTVVDDGVQTTFYADADADGFGDPSDTLDACTARSGYVSGSTDCDDASATVNPGATDVCNGIDDDCDGTIDEGQLNTFFADADADGFGDASTTAQACSAPAGFVADSTDCNDASDAIFPGAAEVCDGVDQSCDGDVDEGVQTTFYADQDADGYGLVTLATDACTAPSGYVSDSTDCDDGVAAVNPGAPEVCNGTDDDCDGAIDDGVAAAYFADVDGDGFGDPDAGITACSPPSGYVSDATDCDDDDAAVNADAAEVCDGVDSDCDGETDEGVLVDYFADLDGDGYGTGDAVSACTAPSGFVATGDDCDDADVDTHPSAPETCTDPLDRNCDGVVGRVDTDADGFAACEECDDLDADVNPDGTELCNGVDDDCDGTVDIGAEDASAFYADSDDDGFTDADVGLLACEAPEGYIAESREEDCDDTDADVNPDATDEPGDGIDQDCDGVDAEVEDTDVEDTDVEDTDVEDTDIVDTDLVDTDDDQGGCSCNKNQSAAGWLGLLALGGLFARRRRG